MTNNIILEMEEYAKEKNVPIMEKEGITFLQNYIEEKNIKTVLEIGTAIGYSAALMSLKGAKVTSIERDNERYEKAKYFVNKIGLNDNITLIHSDAFDTNITEKYDLIFIDAAKAQNIKFIEKFKTNLNKNGSIIIDNINFHGLVGKSETIESKNLRSLVRKIEDFLDYLSVQTEFKYEKKEVGDGLIILKEA